MRAALDDATTSDEKSKKTVKKGKGRRKARLKNRAETASGSAATSSSVNANATSEFPQANIDPVASTSASAPDALGTGDATKDDADGGGGGEDRLNTRRKAPENDGNDCVLPATVNLTHSEDDGHGDVHGGEEAAEDIDEAMARAKLMLLALKIESDQ